MGLWRREASDFEDDSLRLDGCPLKDWGMVLDADGVEVGPVEWSTGLTVVPGSMLVPDLSLTDGQGRAFPSGRREVTIHALTFGDEVDGIDSKVRFTSRFAGRDVSVRWRSYPGEWRGRVTGMEWTDSYREGVFAFSQVEMRVSVDAPLYGPRRSVPLVRGSNRVVVKGGMPALPVFTLAPSSGVRTLSVTVGGAHVTIPDPGRTITGSVTVDCVRRETRVNGSLTRITLDSDYMPLSPGPVEVTLTNCTGQVSYEPRFLV